YLTIRDGGSNIVKAVNDLNLESESCFLHNLHLIVSDALNSQRALKDIIALGRRIVGHFNHSSLACSKFKEIQEKQLHIQYKKLVQDVSTRWNSTFYMLNRLQELQNAISIYANGNNEIQNFSSYQWTLIENCIKLLQPFEEITKQISSSKSLISEVIPMVVTLQRYLLKSAEVSGIGTMKEALEKNIHKRFSTIQLNKHYSLATILDPQYKTLFFDKDRSYDEVVKSLLLSLMKEKASEFFKSSENVNNSKSIAKYSSSENSHKSTEGEECVFISVWDVFSEITNNSNINNKITDTDKNELTSVQELNKYISLPVIERKESPLNWWEKNQNNFPILSKLVYKYLSPPASSVYSERLFSEAGIIYEQRRNRILPKNAEQLLFLHLNLSILKNDKLA
ncbi:zinc finger BED domain-containing protein 4-like, partial [Parasteatoda tepidariorum]|uniref:zinc finger BED domain-containing protein 4-like n=1 Tax=Parasteatoda tepidariorum TaxID=114398 RepID=UPI0039BCD8A0